MKVRVIKRFLDVQCNIQRREGQEYTTTQARAEELGAKGLVKILVETIKTPEDNKPITKKASPKRK